ncbi:MAG: hypothetical protein AB7V00_05430, partial [Bacilli bacterium]
MRKLTNKLFISILTVAFAVIALGTTTFAWFTLSNTATVSPFQASVTAGEGIEISLDGTNWYTTLSEALMETTLNTSTFKFDLVTTPDGTTFTTLGGGDATGKYLSFTLYFRSFADASPSIYWNGVTLTSTGKSWQPDVSFNDSEAGVTTALTTASSPVMRYAANSGRILVAGDSTSIYELPSDFNSQDNTVLGEKLVTEITGTEDGANAYYVAKKGTAPAGAAAAVIPATVTDSTLLNDAAILVLDTGSANAWSGTLTVSIWLEGWDPNAFNSILSDTLT